MQTAFFLDDEFRDNIKSSSIYDSVPSSNNSSDNVSDPRPRIAWISGILNPLATQTRFEVDSNNRYIDIEDSGANTETLTIPRGAYTGPGVAAAITAQLAASTYASAWLAGYNVTAGKFQIYDPTFAAPTIKLLWQTGPNGSDGTNKSLGRELGWVAPEGESTDTALSDSHIPPYERYNTHTFVRFELPEAKDLRAWMCEVANQEVGTQDATIDVSYIKMYGNALNLGPILNNWQLNASVDITFSPGGYFSENQIRLAYYNSGAASTVRNWYFSWRHQDSHQTHVVKLCKAFKRTWSDTGRTLTTLKGQGMLNTGQSLGIDNYYPVQRLRRWVAPLAFDAWPAAEYRTVVQGVVHHGRQDGFMWALRWDDIADGTVDAEDDADEGFLLWATLQDYSLDTYVGESADYISGEIKIEQLR